MVHGKQWVFIEPSGIRAHGIQVQSKMLSTSVFSHTHTKSYATITINKNV